eukprot:GHVU01072981.1.p1 GENE.GHVU01072981.1~~GHVU01072981.1.p1  ORF type:complete len:103 (-),score=17.10 GHVU01072981.1:76-384(-)
MCVCMCVRVYGLLCIDLPAALPRALIDEVAALERELQARRAALPGVDAALASVKAQIAAVHSRHEEPLRRVQITGNYLSGAIEEYRANHHHVSECVRDSMSK